MRKLYSLITMLLIVTIASSQQTYTWNKAAGGDWGTPGNWTPARNTPATNDILVFSLGSSYTVANVPSQTIGRLNISAGTVTFSGLTNTQSLQINNNSGGADFIIADGASLIQNASLETITLGNNATATISGTFTENGTYNANGTNNNATTTISGTGIFDNRGTLTSSNENRLVMANGSTYIHARNGGNVPTATWNNNSNIEFTGVVDGLPGNLDAADNYGNFTWNCPLQTGNLSFATDVALINGNFNVVSTGTGDIRLKNTGGGTQTTTVAGNFNLSGGFLYICGTSGGFSLIVRGNVSITGGTLARGGSSTSNFTFDGTTTQTYSKTGGTISGAVNFSIPGGSTVDFGTSVINGSGTFTLSNNARIITANANGINSAGASGSIQVSGTRSFNSGADYEFRGAATGVFTTTSNPQVSTITINNTGGNVTLNQPMTVNEQLTLTAGALICTSTNLLNIVNDATVSGASNASFVSGPIRKTGNDAFTFPVGKVGTGYVPIAMSAPNSAGTQMTAEYVRGTPPNPTNITAVGIRNISGCDYWTLDRTAGNNPTINITLNWNANNPCNGVNYVTQPSTIKAVHYNGTSWNTASPTNGTGSATTGSVTWNNVNTFSPFALGTTATANNNPLPVLFDNVKAFEKNGGIEIVWSNLTERDLIEYVVERSLNGRDYVDFSSQSPKNNQNDKADYIEFDANPFAGANFYRIRVQEISGKVIYSKVLRVDMGGSKKGFSIYPNPVIGNQVTLSLTGVRQGTYKVRVVTSTGVDVYQKNITTQASGITQTLQLPSSVKPGIYTMLVSGDGYSQNQLFIVQ